MRRSQEMSEHVVGFLREHVDPQMIEVTTADPDEHWTATLQLLLAVSEEFEHEPIRFTEETTRILGRALVEAAILDAIEGTGRHLRPVD